MINVLSVDWDYFIGATAEQRALLFPDSGNEDFTAEGQIYIWGRHYTESAVGKEFHGSESILDIPALNDENKALYTLVEKYKKPATRMSVHESHKEIIDVISCDLSAFDGINVFNIGFNHDCNTNVNLAGINCGNWAQILLNESKIAQLYWVKREDSDDEIDLIKRVYNNVQELHDNPETLAEGIDYIFLCRSGMRTLPHLDKNFNKMATHLAALTGVQNPNGLSEIDSRWTQRKQDEIHYLIGQYRIINEHHMKQYAHSKNKGLENEEGSADDNQGLQDKINQYYKDYCAEHSLEIDKFELA